MDGASGLMAGVAAGAAAGACGFSAGFSAGLMAGFGARVGPFTAVGVGATTIGADVGAATRGLSTGAEVGAATFDVVGFAGADVPDDDAFADPPPGSRTGVM